MHENVVRAILGVAVLTYMYSCSSEPEPAVSEESAVSPVTTQTSVTQSTKVRTIPGKVREVADDGKHIVIEAADGTEEKIDVAAHTVSHHVKESAEKGGEGMADLAKTGAKEAEKGAHAVVHFTEKAGKKTAEAISLGFDETVKTSKVVIQQIDHKGRTITAKTQDGAEKVYQAAKRTTVAAGDKTVEFGEWVGDKSKEGAEVTVHFVEESGKKFAHGLEDLGDSLK